MTRDTAMSPKNILLRVSYPVVLYTSIGGITEMATVIPFRTAGIMHLSAPASQTMSFSLLKKTAACWLRGRFVLWSR